MAKKQMTAAQLANLPQYKGLSEKELEKVRDRILSGDTGKIDEILNSFEKDYDLSNMTANDMLALRELARIFAALGIVENKIKDVLSEGEDVSTFERLNKVASQLRSDASSIQKDLNITRKARQDAGGQSVVEFIEELKKRAQLFLKDRLVEIYCPKCKMLLCKVWFLYPEQPNEMTMICGRERCGHKFSLKSGSLVLNKNIKAGPPF